MAYSDCEEDGSYSFDEIEPGEYILYSTKEGALTYKNTISILPTSDILKKLIGTYTYSSSEIDLLDCYMVSPEL